jgi:hypothetical protein
MRKTLLAALLVFLGASCTRSRVLESRYVVNAHASAETCPYVWQEGDYWEFLAWAILDDVPSAGVLALTSGYLPEILPAPGTEISIPMDPSYSEAVQNRMQAARLVARATEARETDRNHAMQLLRQAMELDSQWSVPATNATVLLLEDGRTEEALRLLAPLAHKTAPAMILAGMAWRNGNTPAALAHLAEAMAVHHPPPEVLAAAGMAWGVTGDRERAGMVIGRLLQNAEASSELRIAALRFALALGEE